jgi:hypothetical protein
MLNRSQDSLTASLEHYGIPAARFRNLRKGASAETLDYLDLLRLPETPTRSIDAILPDGVAESNEGTTLYVVKEDRLFQQEADRTTQLESLTRKLACRGDVAYLARVRPGELLVTPIQLSRGALEWERFVRDSSGRAVNFFPALSQGLIGQKKKQIEADFVFQEMFRLISTAADRIAGCGIERSEVLSLVGRALFFRFLWDRSIVSEADLPRIAPGVTSIEQVFANPKNAALASRWMNRTFNGDLLPLPENDGPYFETVGSRSDGRVFSELQGILERSEPTGASAYQKRFDFGDFDFAHIPVGLLSQVYERFAWKWERPTAKATSVHYTPRRIAEMVVDEAFDGLPNATDARILDPACGASVFLVLAFRRLYQERWRTTGSRPNTTAIRSILMRQLVGFDVSESALRLAALSLYLTAIELDPEPVPPQKLRFDELRGKVLYNFRDEKEESKEGFVAGSLGEQVSSHFDHAFDLVIGNPPWTSLGKKETALANQLSALSQRVIRDRGFPDLAKAYRNPDRVPDLPFLWKATEWCKTGGRIALTLPARLLFKQETGPSKARETLLRLIEVNGIINGSNLSDTKVWPEMNQPFILLFARNRVPPEGHSLRMVTPHYDEVLNRKGLLRIDSKSTETIDLAESFETPWLWKALSIGTRLDLDLRQSIQNHKRPSIRAYWKENLKLNDGRGYQELNEQEQFDATFLCGLLNLTRIPQGKFGVEGLNLTIFQRTRLGRPGSPEIYQPPLFLLKQAPPSNRHHAFAAISDKAIAYSRNFYGYSAAGNPDGKLLTRYLLIYAHSALWIHCILIQAPTIGAERRTVYKKVFDQAPILPVEELSDLQRSSILGLSRRLVERDTSVFDEIDTFFYDLFDLDEYDQAVIRDTLDTALPFKANRQRACDSPSPTERFEFRETLGQILAPFFAISNESLKVTEVESSKGSLEPFHFLTLSKSGQTVEGLVEAQRTALLQLAEDSGATRIIHYLSGGLLIGILNQYRYWTPTRARLLAAEIARDHLDVFDT